MRQVGSRPYQSQRPPLRRPLLSSGWSGQHSGSVEWMLSETRGLLDPVSGAPARRRRHVFVEPEPAVRACRDRPLGCIPAPWAAFADDGIPRRPTEAYRIPAGDDPPAASALPHGYAVVIV